MLFAPGPIWAKRTAVIIAGGNSFTAADARIIGMARARDDVRVVAVNDAVYPCWFADLVYASDSPWWKHHLNLPGFAGKRLGLRYQESVKAPMRQPDGIDDVVESVGADGVTMTPGYVCHGGNSGYVAVQVAAQLGAARIILVGFDMKGDGHWFGEHPEGVRRQVANKSKWVARYEVLAAELRRIGIETINASPDSALIGFPKAKLCDLLGG